ncbi:MAG: transglycosylase SLT domain-containing protein [Bacteroidia bacterium]
MNLRSLLFFIFVLAFFSLQAQNSGYITKPQQEGQEDENIHEMLDSMAINYNLPAVSSSSYDTIILNTRGYEPGEVPTFSPEVTRQQLREIPTIIPLDYNIYVQRYIDVYSRRRRDQVSRMLGLAKVYFPIFEEELDRRRMPMEIKYLAVVESALNPHAVSRVGATGLWQFMLYTGREYGLVVNSFVDERKNPFKATSAAMDYLQDAYDEFGDWQLAIASYNCGRGNVRKAISRSGGKRNFWEIRPYLPRETRGYVPALIAATYVFNHAADFNIYPIHADFDHNVDTVQVVGMDISLKEIANMTGTDLNILLALNPDLKLKRIPYSRKPYVLRAPYAVTDYFTKYGYTLKKEYNGPRYASSGRASGPMPGSNYKPASTKRPYQHINGGTTGNGKLRYHTVRDGEVVGAIAEAYGVSARQVANWNRLYRYRIKVGQKLKIYSNKTPKAVEKSGSRGSASTSKPQASSKPDAKGAVYHRIRRGETIWEIAKKYNGVTSKSILRLNKGVNPSDLKVGDRIRVK